MIIAARVRSTKAFLPRKALTSHLQFDKQFKLMAPEVPACVWAMWIPALPPVPSLNLRGISLIQCRKKDEKEIRGSTIFWKNKNRKIILKSAIPSLFAVSASQWNLPLATWTSFCVKVEISPLCLTKCLPLPIPQAIKDFCIYARQIKYMCNIVVFCMYFTQQL